MSGPALTTGGAQLYTLERRSMSTRGSPGPGRHTARTPRLQSCGTAWEKSSRVRPALATTRTGRGGRRDRGSRSQSCGCSPDRIRGPWLRARDRRLWLLGQEPHHRIPRGLASRRLRVRARPLPGGGIQTHASEQQIKQATETAECMRAHGVTGFPDPIVTARPPAIAQSEYSSAKYGNGSSSRSQIHQRAVAVRSRRPRKPATSTAEPNQAMNRGRQPADRRSLPASAADELVELAPIGLADQLHRPVGGDAESMLYRAILPSG
jgi:hypothetical protein